MDRFKKNRILFINMGINIDAIEGIRFILRIIDRKRGVKNMPIKQFFKILERKLGSSLSREQKEEIVEDLRNKGRIMENRVHNYFVISKPMGNVVDSI